MAPREKLDVTEDSPLFKRDVGDNKGIPSNTTTNYKQFIPIKKKFCNGARLLILCLCTGTVLLALWLMRVIDKKEKNFGIIYLSGGYNLVELQEGSSFFDYYNFYDGSDSIGSAGYNTYVSEARAKKLGIVNVSTEKDNDGGGNQFVYMSSSPTEEGPRESIRLEGKRRFNHGLFIIDLKHMPAGCGVWPAFWLTNEDNWPDNGEIDIVEGVNYQSVAKTALHTSDRCSMFAHVADYDRTGKWDWATGLPDTFTGIMDFNTSKPADDCWNLAPHQWSNQGCVTVSQDEGTIGVPFNTNGGGVYALEWDPVNQRIRSWVFAPHNTVPPNLREAIDTAGAANPDDRVMPDTDLWGLPYALFAIGKNTGCSADHFKGMHVVINLAFCGTVAGNRFFMDCPKEAAELFNNTIGKDPVESCNKWIQSRPKYLDESYWMIKGAYVYQRNGQQS